MSNPWAIPNLFLPGLKTSDVPGFCSARSWSGVTINGFGCADPFPEPAPEPSPELPPDFFGLSCCKTVSLLCLLPASFLDRLPPPASRRVSSSSLHSLCSLSLPLLDPPLSCSTQNKTSKKKCTNEKLWRMQESQLAKMRHLPWTACQCSLESPTAPVTIPIELQTAGCRAFLCCTPSMVLERSSCSCCC